MNALDIKKEGGTARQSRDANLHRQPTPRSVADSEEAAPWFRFDYAPGFQDDLSP